MVHVKVWSGSGSARIIDMTFAGKVGKRCSTLYVQGCPLCYSSNEPKDVAEARQGSVNIQADLEELFPGCTNGGRVEAWSFDVISALVLDRVDASHSAGANQSLLRAVSESIRGVDAPRRPLEAGVEGKWSASADENGIHMRQLDDINEWSEITPHDQSGPRAYALALKVWDKVKRANTLHEAADILRNAGCKLHGYCAMD